MRRGRLGSMLRCAEVCNASVSRRIRGHRLLSDAARPTAEPLYQLQVSAKYGTRGTDISAIHRCVTDEWCVLYISPQGSYTSRLDRDWVIFCVPTSEYLRRANQPPDFSLFPEVFLSVSRRGASVSVVPSTVKSSRHPVFDTREVIRRTNHVRLPHDSVEAVEDMMVEVDPSLSQWSDLRDGVLRLQQLDLDSIRIINSCMAQTVNLQFFEGQVDKMYEIVDEVHQTLEKGSRLRHLRSGTLYRHLGTSNAISNNVLLSGLRNTVRPGSTAWKEERYSVMQDLLWEEFDLEERYEELQRKLAYINDSIKYSLEVTKEDTSLFLERMVVLLIAAELTISAINADLPQKFWSWIQLLVA